MLTTFPTSLDPMQSVYKLNPSTENAISHALHSLLSHLDHRGRLHQNAVRLQLVRKLCWALAPLRATGFWQNTRHHHTSWAPTKAVCRRFCSIRLHTARFCNTSCNTFPLAVRVLNSRPHTQHTQTNLVIHYIEFAAPSYLIWTIHTLRNLFNLCNVIWTLHFMNTATLNN